MTLTDSVYGAGGHVAEVVFPHAIAVGISFPTFLEFALIFGHPITVSVIIGRKPIVEIPYGISPSDSDFKSLIVYLAEVHVRRSLLSYGRRDGRFVENA